MNNRSFTLLEVIAAVSLLAIAVVGIMQGQSGSIRNVLQSEKLSQAYFLAQQKMIETEMEIETKGFDAFLEEEKGDFENEELKEFKWVRRFSPLDLACLWPQAASESAVQADPLLGMAGQFIEANVRKLVIEVEWVENNRTRYASLAQFFVNEKNIEAGAQQLEKAAPGGGN